jgi:hypothetical protein
LRMKASVLISENGWRIVEKPSSHNQEIIERLDGWAISEHGRVKLPW